MEKSDLLFTQLGYSDQSISERLIKTLKVKSVNYASVESEQESAWFEYLPLGTAKQSTQERILLLSDLEAANPGLNFNCYAGRLVQDSGAVDELWGMRMIVAFNVPVSMQNEVDLWYTEEHIPLLTKSEFWLRARRYECDFSYGTQPFTSIAVHDLVDQRALDSDERKIARSTPWRAEFSDSDWFVQAGRFYYTNKELMIREKA